MCLLQRDSQVPRRFFQRGTPGLVEVLFSLSKTQGERLMMFGVIKAEDITKIMPRTAGWSFGATIYQMVHCGILTILIHESATLINLPAGSGLEGELDT